MKKKYKILIHIVYWIYIINQGLFPFYINKLDAALMENFQYFQDVFINTLLNAFSFYSIYYSFPYLIKLKFKPLGILAVIVLIGVVLCIRLPLNFAFWKFIVKLPEKELVIQSAWIWNEFRLVIITGIYAVLIRFMIDWFDSQKLKDELINQRQSSELALLRSQVNPHFLFNTLNNIYSLVYKKSEEAPAAIMKLSRIMRYMLYDSNSDQVPLEKEVDYLKSFIELQELRINQPDYVDFRIEGDIENRTIAPMLLIPFVENAFKHGGKNHSPGITIFLSAGTAQFHFEVTNYKKKNALTKGDEIGGIGLQNIMRRLELLYKGKHELKIEDGHEIFRISLDLHA
ncbi:MAG: sensor histidine kinase [Bacteroidales bacterium]|nr:sensor histidine kinase [Bacteroidales bacterium]